MEPASPTQPQPTFSGLMPQGLGADAAARAEAQYRAFVAEATLILPIGLTLLVGVLGFLGPYLLSRIGPTEAVGWAGVEAFLLGSGRARWLVVGVAVVLLLAGLVGVRTAPARQAFERGGLVAPLAGKLILFIPLIAAVAVLLLSVVLPVLKALSVT